MGTGDIHSNKIVLTMLSLAGISVQHTWTEFSLEGGSLGRKHYVWGKFHRNRERYLKLREAMTLGKDSGDENKPLSGEKASAAGCEEDYWWGTGEIRGERGIKSSLLPSQFASGREGWAVPSAWQTGKNDRKEVLWLGREKGTANICNNMFLTRGTGLKSLRENKNCIIFLS